MIIETDDQILAAERAALSTILDGRKPAAVMERLAILAGACPAPLHVWFTDRTCRVVALAAEAALTGSIVAEGTWCAEYLAQLPLGVADDVLQGRAALSKPYAPVAYDGSALAWIGGYNSLDPIQSAFAPVASLPSCARFLRHAADRRKAIAGLQDLAALVARTSLRDGPSAVLAAGLDRLGGMLRDETAASVGEYLTQALDTAERRAGARDLGKASSASWGLAGLDALCPLRGGRLYVLAAPPGVGKTSLALQAATATTGAHGQSAAAIASLEMSGADLATILAGRALGIAPAAITDRAPSITPEAWTAIRDLAHDWTTAGSTWIREATTERATITTITAWITERHAAARGTLALVVVDYLQLIEGHDPRATEYQTISATSRALKRLAIALDVPVIALSQLSRDGRKASRSKTGAVAAAPEPRLEDLRGSGSIEQDADAVIFIHRPDAGAQRPPIIPVRVIVAKHRGGQTGECDAEFVGRHQLFREITQHPGHGNTRMFTAPQDTENVF